MCFQASVLQGGGKGVTWAKPGSLPEWRRWTWESREGKVAGDSRTEYQEEENMSHGREESEDLDFININKSLL